MAHFIMFGAKAYFKTAGFISIDCGATSGTRYQDSTGILYVSDDSFIDTGRNYNISQNFTSLSKQTSTLRSFPNDSRNCYTLWNVTQGSKYLLRATFLYGNYDGKQLAQISTPLQFDLYVDVSFWRRVNITDASREYAYEVVTVAAHDSIWVCLVNINAGTPFISALELRPIKSYLYPYAFQNQSNAVLFRLNYGPTKEVVIRYPDDPYDRIWSWYQYNSTILTSINTNEDITKHYDVDLFEAPKSVLQTALTPISSPNLTTASYDYPASDADFPGYYAVLHFSELRNLSRNQSRQFDIYLNGWIWFYAATPLYLKAKYVYETMPEQSSHNVFTLVPLSNSTLPPILNGMEVYWPVSMKIQQLTNADDVSAILAVKIQYQIVRNWNGDPCSPINLSWYGVTCRKNEPPQITSLNLSYSGLSGKISDSFAKMKEIVYLDLSHNNLSGDIPDSLTSLQALQVLNLSGNHLNGHVPDNLIKRNNSGILLLLVDSCTNCGGKSKNSLSRGIIALIVAGFALAVIIVALLLLQPSLTRMRKRRRGSEDQTFETQVHHEIKRFTYQELKEITNNSSHTIGRGGFGVVYHGCLENKEVAVKVCSQKSGQGKKQFLAEVRSLSRVSHKNLVTLVGYCKDGDYLAVVYEFMPKGSLFDHLRGEGSTSGPLNWRMRLKILLEAAQALDYLHTGCSIVHRDVKSSNILLGQNFEAKVSDLGLARTFSADTNSSFITLCGTPGYIDPEYQRTSKMTAKSDVYSFGVILLEIVTGKPPILNATENIHIIELVKDKLDTGSIEDVIDSKIKGECDMNSVQNVVDLAMVCTSDKSINRPTMADVVIHLKDSVQMEHRQKGKLQHNDKSDTNSSVSTSEGHRQKGKLRHSDMSDTNTSVSTSEEHS